MNLEEKIARINELYHKSKAEGLTEEELKEQQILRREYIDAFKRNLRGQLDNISIKEADGSITNLGEKYGNKKGNQKEGVLMQANLPKDSMILLSFVNTKIRNDYHSLDAFCEDMQVSKEEIIDILKGIDYEYDESRHQFV